MSLRLYQLLPNEHWKCRLCGYTLGNFGGPLAMHARKHVNEGKAVEVQVPNWVLTEKTETANEHSL